LVATSGSAPQRARGYQITDLNTAGVTIWESDEADKLIHVFSYFETAGFEKGLYDLFIGTALATGGFLAIDVRSFINGHLREAESAGARVQ
jgi:hypothetical protein